MIMDTAKLPNLDFDDTLSDDALIFGFKPENDPTVDKAQGDSRQPIFPSGKPIGPTAPTPPVAASAASSVDYQSPYWILQLLDRLYLNGPSTLSSEFGDWCTYYRKLRHPLFASGRHFQPDPFMEGRLHVIHRRLQRSRCAWSCKLSATKATINKKPKGNRSRIHPLVVRTATMRCVCHCTTFLIHWELGKPILNDLTKIETYYRLAIEDDKSRILSSSMRILEGL